MLPGTNPTALFSENSSKKLDESSELNRVFTAHVGFWDERFTEVCTRGWCQPSRPSPTSAVVVTNRVVTQGCFLKHGCLREGLLLC